MKNLIIILPDQISENLPSLKNIDKDNDIIFFYEYIDLNIKHHPKKIAYLLTCIRRFESKFKENKYKTDSLKLDDNIPDFKRDIANIAINYPDYKIKITEPSCHKELESLSQLSKEYNIQILEDNRFLSSKEFFQKWANGKKQLRMEFFYREMRKKYNILMDGDKPEGGKWNYDTENRKPPKEGLEFPQRLKHKKSPILIELLDFVDKKFGDNFGDLTPFYYATDKEEAQKEADHFIREILPYFGEYQDAMVKGEAYLYHSLLSSYINNGLLDPLEIIRQAQEEYYNKNAPLNAVEGFIRQILGWREYIRGIYWLYMPEYSSKNYLDAKMPLPDFYWGANTDMNCIKETVDHTKIHAYSHHIQRLMVTGNFALIAGLNPDEVDDWYGAVYSDAFQWVHMPNTKGMSLFADGGIIASKPYAASGKYINRMSNYCKSCKYDPNETIGENACPFNALYWNFLEEHKDKFYDNQRMKYVYATWNKMDPSKKKAILDKAKNTLESLS